jgi:hypothetical protein
LFNGNDENEIQKIPIESIIFNNLNSLSSEYASSSSETTTTPTTTFSQKNSTAQFENKNKVQNFISAEIIRDKISIALSFC